VKLVLSKVTPRSWISWSVSGRVVTLVMSGSLMDSIVTACGLAAMSGLPEPSTSRMFESEYLPRTGRVGRSNGLPGYVESSMREGNPGPVKSATTLKSFGSMFRTLSGNGWPLLTNPVVTCEAMPLGTTWYSGPTCRLTPTMLKSKFVRTLGACCDITGVANPMRALMSNPTTTDI